VQVIINKHLGNDISMFLLAVENLSDSVGFVLGL